MSNCPGDRLKCQFCGKEIEEPLYRIGYILAKENYNPTFFLWFQANVKENGGIVHAKLCKHCVKELLKVLYEEVSNES